MQLLIMTTMVLTVDAAIDSTYSVEPDKALDQLAKRNPSDFDHFTYNKGLSATAVSVAADGSNTINLYYDRDVITINLYYCEYSFLELYPYNKVTCTGLYGQEFDEDNKWDNRYDWYEKDSNGRLSTRLTFISYFYPLLFCRQRIF